MPKTKIWLVSICLALSGICIGAMWFYGRMKIKNNVVSLQPTVYGSEKRGIYVKAAAGWFDSGNSVFDLSLANIHNKSSFGIIRLSPADSLQEVTVELAKSAKRDNPGLVFETKPETFNIGKSAWVKFRGKRVTPASWVTYYASVDKEYGTFLVYCTSPTVITDLMEVQFEDLIAELKAKPISQLKEKLEDFK